MASLNSVELFVEHARRTPRKSALFIPNGPVGPVRHGGTEIDFGELSSLAARVQRLLREEGLRPGDHLLLVEGLGPRLYGIVIGALSMGVCVVLVEPWMAVSRIDHVVRLAQPKLFLGSAIGMLWGARVPAIRAIKKWVRASRVDRAPSGELELEPMSPDAPGILTFTSGTTGKPKGVVRSQGYLVRQYQVLSKNLGTDSLSGPDLCIFANFAFLNLAGGRGTVLVPPAWKSRHLRALDSLPERLRPESLAAGPAFLARLMAEARVPSLKSIHVGGALSDCALFEEGFKRWPEAHWAHVYGSSEAEPVALSDAHEAVRLSREKGFFQMLHLGKPVPEIRASIEEDTVWIAGPHVCPGYLGNEEENRIHKRRDADGVVWHAMGDRIREDGHGWWYSGRSGQRPEHFVLEQQVYSFLQSSASFITPGTHPGEPGLELVGEGVARRRAEIQARFPEISAVREAMIRRDRRHRARIDRAATLKRI